MNIKIVLLFFCSLSLPNYSLMKRTHKKVVKKNQVERGLCNFISTR